MTRVAVRTYGPLNGFLSPHMRQVTFFRLVAGHPTVKDLVESLGVPHPEVDLILANGTSVPFDYAVQDGDRIAVFPRFMTLEIGTLTRVRPAAKD
jgi:sulfur carrier protein ThiS